MRGLTLLAWIGLTSLASAQQPANQPMHLKVRLPADAQLWLDGTATTTQGPVREFLSPPLPPGQSFVYTVRVRWQRYGIPIDQKREITVRVGDFIDVDFEGSAGGYTMYPVIRYGERAYHAPSRQQIAIVSPTNDSRLDINTSSYDRRTGSLNVYGFGR